MRVSRREVLGTISTTGIIGVAGCGGGSGSCGPGETTVEELTNQEPTGITQDPDERVTLVGELVNIDRINKEAIRIDDTTGLAELLAGPASTWKVDELPDTGTCINAWGFHESNDHEVADVVLNDVVAEVEE